MSFRRLIQSVEGVVLAGAVVLSVAAEARPPLPQSVGARPGPAGAGRGAEVAPKPATPKQAGPAPHVLLKEAEALYRSLDYDRVIPIAVAVLAHPDATADERMNAYLYHGSCLSIVGDPIEAEKPFRFLLRGRPDFEMPQETPPKIIAVFRKVQAEEKAILDQTRELARTRLIAGLRLEGEPIEAAVGGFPVPFNFGVRDASGAVQQVRVQYRREGDKDYSSLALVGDLAGRWRGEVPGEWTENKDGFTMEYFVTTLDEEEQPLLVLKSAEDPFKVPVEPGTVADAIPYYKTVWFWTLTGIATSAVLASGVAAGYIASQPPESDLGKISLDE